MSSKPESTVASKPKPSKVCTECGNPLPISRYRAVGSMVCPDCKAKPKPDEKKTG